MNQIAVTEREISQMLNLSLPYLRKDRATKRTIPFFRAGRAIRYCPDTVRAAVQKQMEGGAK